MNNDLNVGAGFKPALVSTDAKKQGRLQTCPYDLTI